MFVVMKDTDCASKTKFIEIFWSCCKQVLGTKHIIQRLEIFDFMSIYEWHLTEKERKAIEDQRVEIVLKKKKRQKQE